MNLHPSPLELDVVINGELLSRPSRAPNYGAESQAMIALAQTVTDEPNKILQRLAETALQLCRADTAGISLLEKKDGADLFRLEALAGVFNDRRNSTMPRDASPCGTTIDRNATQLMYMPERAFPALRSQPPVVEVLLVPFHVRHKPIGTIWIVAHDELRKFDRGDERIIKRLARFASASWQLWQTQTSTEVEARNIRQQGLDLAAANGALQAHLENKSMVEEKLLQLNGEMQAKIVESMVKLTARQVHVDNVVATIAHDFNNILHVIQAHASLIMTGSAEPNKIFEHAEVITATVEEGVALVRQMLDAGPKIEPSFELVDIHDLLRRAIKQLSPIFSTTITVTTDFDPRVPMIKIDAGLIYRAILNLYTNARDAMPDGGQILLQTQTAAGATLRQRFFGAKAEHYVHISVADTGIGMEADVRSRVFDPYFTTKTADRGTGLGLSMVHGMASAHGGFVEVTSEPGCGSTFHIYLPIEEDEGAAVAVLAGYNDKARLPRRETVLYGEDDPRLSELMHNLLASEGFRILKARDGAEAVKLHSRYKDLITVALLDFGLPKLNGWEAFQQMKTINPKLKGILTSGYVSTEAESWLAKGDLEGVLQKPYDAAEVLATIERAIHRI